MHGLRMDGNDRWLQVVENRLGIASSNSSNQQLNSKFSSLCPHQLLEETEDELTELIKRGGLKPGGVSKALCQNLSKHCEADSDDEYVNDDDDEVVNDEL
ncbi:hypothetical protein HPP92_012557 [Vanilla planifolia]|uniref:DUF3456 domain-containing protein n=1 Tax=Vanilla planifolia TaxID=51239 RepID=A0A835QZN7_VANPL|nr:hypothetical protein HPP92_012557 [Vanilla planifolia]